MDHEITHHQQATLQDYSTYSSTSMAMQSFEPNSEIYGGLHEGIEMLGLMQPPTPFQRAHALNESLMVAPEALTTSPWQTTSRLPLSDDSSARINIFPAIEAGNQQPASSRHLSLTLFHPQRSSSMFQPAYGQHALFNNRCDQAVAQKAMDVLQDGRLLQSLSPATASSSTFYPEQFLLKNSKYMVPAQQLLNESFNLDATKYASKPSPSKSKQGEPSTSKLQQLPAMDVSELQKRKAKLLSLVEEVDKRYKRYCEQTRSLVCSFEAVAGGGAGGAYLALASTVMSRHFRTLRDCIVDQIRAVKKVIEEVDPAATKSTRAETPRLKMIDQYVQQQKAFHQVGMMESHPWRPQRGLPQRAVSILRAWLFEHFLHPYPSDVDKQILSRQTGLSRSQVSNWFINARVRLWKPMVEEMYLEEVKEHDERASHHDENNSSSRGSDMKSNQNPNILCTYSELETDEDEKPATAQLLVDSDSLSSIVNNTHGRGRSKKDQIVWESTHGHSTGQLQASSDQGNFDVMDLDFGSYNQCSNEENYGKGVLLTLGLQQAQQQHDSGGMCLSFSPASRNPQFFAGEQTEECHGGQFSILDGSQSIPYRNLTEAQLLNHFG